MPAIVEGVAGDDIRRPLIGAHPIQVDFAKEDGVQGEEAAQGEILAVVVLVGEAHIDGQGAVEHIVLFDHQVFGTAADFRRAP